MRKLKSQAVNTELEMKTTILHTFASCLVHATHFLLIYSLYIEPKKLTNKTFVWALRTLFIKLSRVTSIVTKSGQITK